MFIELVDALRCPRPHEESWLVVTATTLEARHIVEGLLGCPVCRSEYPVHDGIADLRIPSANVDAREMSVAPSRAASALDLPADAEQLAAMLNLADPLGVAVLAGRWSARAEEMLDLGHTPPLLLVDPPVGMIMLPGLSGIRSDAVLPIAEGAVRAIAIDTIDPARAGSAALVVRAGGRIVAPVQTPVPDGVRELARDDTVWVGEREARASALVSLHVRRR